MSNPISAVENGTGIAATGDTQTLELRLLAARVRRAEALARLAERKVRDEEASRVNYEFFGEIDEDNQIVDQCISTLGSWSNSDPGRDINITLNSPGGSVTLGMALYDFLLDLRARGHKVTITVLGEAASMASIILQAADVRLIGPHSWIMIHEVSSADLGKLSELEDQLETTKRMQGQLVEILSKRSLAKGDGKGLTVDAIKAMWHKTDVWLTPEQALEYHLVDGITGGSLR